MRALRVLLLVLALAATAAAQPARPPHPLLELLVRHHDIEGELATTIRVNPAEFSQVVRQLTGETPAPAATSHAITVRIVADPAHPRGFWTIDRE